MDEQQRLSSEECRELFAAMFPAGPAGQDVLRELAPEGWDRSGLVAIAHPSPQTVFEERVRMHENLSRLTRDRNGEAPLPTPTMQEILESYKASPVDAETECADLVARCLWDIFSDNQDVIAPDGRIADIGSFRGTGGFIADWLNELSDKSGYDYMDFYMGTIWVSRRADLTPVYRMIFGRLKRLGFNWKYSFPRLGVVRFERPSKEDENLAYDPSAGFEKEQEESKRRQEFNELHDSLREGYNESVRESRTQPPPAVVQAYSNVFGKLPDGWPPEEDLGWADD